MSIGRFITGILKNPSIVSNSYKSANNAVDIYSKVKNSIQPKYKELFKNHNYLNLENNQFADLKQVYHITTPKNSESMIQQVKDSLKNGGNGSINNNISDKMRFDSDEKAQIYVGLNGDALHEMFDHDGVKLTFLVPEKAINTDEERGTDYVKNGYEAVLKSAEICTNRDELKQQIEREGFLGDLPIGPELYLKMSTFTKELLERIKEAD